MTNDMRDKGLLMVRAIVPDPGDRDAFDDWYAREHLPDAVRAFGAEHGWRCWCITDPSVHIAFYVFPDAAAADAIRESEALRELVAEFDRRWNGRVTRTREILSCVEVESGGGGR